MRLLSKTSIKKHNFNHCSTICKFGNGMLIAYYSGSRECAKDQRVYIRFFGENPWEECLEEGTGNPVLIESEDEVILIYSVFTRFDVRSIEQWQFCRLEKIRITKNGCGTPEPMDLGIGYLARCPAISIEGKFFLPLYQESPGQGLILSSNDCWNWEHHSEIVHEKELIQPTLWFDDGLKALLRVLRGKPPFAFYSEFDGIKWTYPRPSSFHNLSNSIVIISSNNPLVIWNSSPENRRYLLMRRLNAPMTEESIVLTDSFGSYPSYAWKDNKLHITFTQRIFGKYEISYQIWEIL